MSKIKMFDILKIKIQDIIKSNFDLHIEEDNKDKYIIKQQDTPLFRQLALIRGSESKIINELIFVEAKHNKKRTDDLKKLLSEGFNYNNKHYIRFGKSSSQAKDGITVFIDAAIHSEMLERSQLGVSVEKCIISKYESYRCLILSSCQMIKEKLPYIVIVDEYKKVIPKQHVRYAVEKDIEYVDRDTKEKKVAKNQKFIEESIRDIEISPFDGFGVHTKEVSKIFGKHVSNKYTPILYQIRLPFMKGVTVESPFKEYYKEIGVTEIEDVFGKTHKVEDIDCIWNTTMWKGYGIFKNEFGKEAWNEYLKSVDKYQYKIGISKYSHHTSDINLYSRMNFQYLQCLDLINPKYLQHFKERTKYNILDKDNWGKVINVAKYSTDLFERIIKGDKLYTLKFLGIKDTSYQSLESKYVEAVLINDIMLKDPCVKKMLKRKLDKAITQLKYGKIYTEGFYHTVVGDVVGYLEYCAGLKNIAGCLNAGEFYANTLPLGECLSFRSPLVDPSEVNKINLVHNELTKKYFQHFKEQDVCMINMHDLTMQQQGGMDEDGDAILLCKNKILIDSKINKPIVVDIEDKKSSDPVNYNMDNIVKYECNSRDNRIGEITNIATSILNQAPEEDEKWRKRNEDNISLLRLYQGKEIDFVKTGFRWVISKNLRRYLKRLPYFLLYNYPKKLNVYNKIREINKENNPEDKIQYNAFRSPSPMNELCDYICQWERHNINWDRSLINNGHLLINPELELSDKNIVKRIKKVYDEFDVEFRTTIDEDGELTTLLDKYKNKLNTILKNKQLLANYCIKTAYRSISSDKVLCWSLFGDIMLENLRTNSDERQECIIIEAEQDKDNSVEFLGKYYKLIKKN